MFTLFAIFSLCWALILYTYVGFPLLLAALARTRLGRKHSHRSDCDGDSFLRVAMVVAAFNEDRVLQQKLENTWQLDYPADRFRIYIGSDGSSDRTAEILASQRDPRLKTFLFAERRGKISVLNDLMRRVDADIVVMSDANTMFDRDAIRKIVRHFGNPDVGCVSGALHLEQDGGVSGEGIYWKYEGWIKRNESRLGFQIGCNGGIFAIRRHLYQPLPRSTVVEDFVLTMHILRHGCRVLFDPEARAVEPACASARAEMVRKIRIGAGDFQALGLTADLLHPRNGIRAFAYWGHKVLRWLVPMFFLIALVANVGLLTVPVFRWVLAAQVVGAGLAWWSYSGRPGIPVPRLVRPVSYFYLMNYALFCGFLRFLFRTQRVTWDRG